MKFNGETLKSQSSGDVIVPRANGKHLTFHVQAIGLGDEQKGAQMFPDPRPPVELVLDKKGMPVRDPRTEKVMYETNLYEPGFVKRAEEAARMQMAVDVIDALAGDPSVTWDTDATHGTKDFYLAAFEEMRASGLTLGDLKLIKQKSRELSNLDQKALERAAEAFSQKGE